MRTATRSSGFLPIRARLAGAWAGAFLLVSATLCSAANERGFWALWQKHIAEPENHEQVLAACNSFINENKTDPLASVAQTLAAWHLLKMGRSEEAREALVPWLGTTANPTYMGAREMARAWLTRMDIEEVMKSLQEYYQNELRYPDKLAELTVHPRIPKSLHPPMADRWGSAWSYAPSDFKVIPGFRGQRYRIASPMIRESSKLAEALEIPYGALIRVEPVRVLKGADGTPMVQLRRTEDGAGSGAALAIQLGSGAEGLFLAHVGPRLIIVCDRIHWQVLIVPR